MNNSFIKNIFIFFITFGILIFPLAPVNFYPMEISSPDLLFCFLYSLSVKNPKKRNLFLIIFSTLIADVLWMRAIGLWSLLTFVFIEMSRIYLFQKKEQSFFFEIAIFSICITTMFTLNNVILFLMISKTTTLQLGITYLLSTIILYPFVSIFVKIFKNKNRPIIKNKFYE